MAETFNLSDVFISYSRRDKAFVHRIVERLKEDGRSIWIDWEDIPPTANWWSEIQNGIESANTFVFIITPDSVQSKVCRDEIDYALKLGKRFVPVLHRPIDAPELSETLHPAINSHNWVFFREDDDFDTAYEALKHALDIDLSHVRTHTRLLVRARDWDARGRDNSYLLTGKEIQEAQAWLEQATDKQPKPVDLHMEFIRTSRMQQRIRQRNFALGTTVTIIIGALAILSFALFQNASSNLSLANVRGTEARDQALTAAFNADVAQTNAADAFNAQSTADANANIAATSAADALDAQSTADSNASIAIQQALAAATARNEAQSAANVAATNAADAINAQGTADANADIAATSAADALDAQSTADTLRLTAEGDAVQRGETAIAALATSEQRGTAIAIAQADAQQNAQRARAIALAAQSEQALRADNRQLALLLALEAVSESAISWEAERVLAQAIMEDFRAQPIQLNDDDDNSGSAIMAKALENKWVALAYEPSQIRLWSLAEDDFIATYNDHDASITALAFSPDETLIASGDADGVVRVRDIAQPDNALVLERIHIGRIAQLVWSANGERLLTRGDRQQDGRAFIWDVATGERLHELRGHDGAITGAYWASLGSQIATGDTDGRTIVWDARTGEIVHRYDDHEGAITTMAWTSDGRYLATGGRDNRVFIYEDGVLLRRLDQHIGDVIKVLWSPNDRYLATASFDGTVRVWLMREDNPLAILIGHTRPILDIAWSDDNNRIMTLAGDLTLRLWNIRNTTRPIIFELPERNLAHIEWLDRRTLISTTNDASPPQRWDLWAGTHDLVPRAQACCVTRLLTYEESVSAGVQPVPSAPIPETIPSCDNTPESRMYVGVWGSVGRDDSRLLNVRIRPGVANAQIDQIAPGQFFRVVAGPECEGDFAWFEILYGLDARQGWVAEGDFESYYTEPIYDLR